MNSKELLEKFKKLNVSDCGGHGCTGCTGCNYCIDCTRCTDCRYCIGCTNCTNCINCINCILCNGLRNKNDGYWLLNEEVMEEEFEAAKKALLGE